jgi:hypothetical protein
MTPEPAGRRSAALGVALGLYLAWTLATWLLEGRVDTLLRPEAAGARLAYAVVANLVVGIGGAGLVLRWMVRRRAVPPRRLGLRGPGRTAFGTALGLALGAAAFAAQRPVTGHPVVLLNAFAQVWVVSVAEVLVCWAVLATAVGVAAGRTRPGAGRAAGWVAAAVAFGLYHFAHSPPFDTPRLVALLTVVGLATGAFYLLVGELWGTVLFHNFLALHGVTQALGRAGRLAALESPQVPLLLMAAVATGAFVAIDRLLRRT